MNTRSSRQVLLWGEERFGIPTSLVNAMNGNLPARRKRAAADARGERFPSLWQLTNSALMLGVLA